MHILFLGNVDTLKKEKKNQLFPPRGDLYCISTWTLTQTKVGLTYVGEKLGEVGE